MYDGLQSTLRTNWFYWGELRSGVYAERGTAYDRNFTIQWFEFSVGLFQLE